MNISDYFSRNREPIENRMLPASSVINSILPLFADDAKMHSKFSEGALPMTASESQKPKELYEFGPFRVDPEKEVLQRDGNPIPLQPKTFQVLLVLVRHNQEVVTKDDLMKTVWPDTFVEEANLSRNIFLLRKALGESPQDHRYVVTVPGRGYRFAEEVQFVPEQPLDIVAASHARVQVEVKESRRWPWLAIAAVVLLALTSGAALLFVHRKPVLTEKDTIVLADFVNSTGEPVFDGTLRQGLAVQLEQSPFLSIIPDEKIQQTLGLMGQPVDTKLIPAIAREVCQRTASAAVLDGSIARIGTQYLLTLKAVNCESGTTMASTEAQASNQDRVLDALGKVSVEIRNKLGESLSTIQKFDTPLEQATTPSLMALKAYSSGTQALRTKGPDAAAPFFKHAVELDPNFAVAYAYLGVMASATLEPRLSVDYRTKAFELRDRASEAEKYWITATYHKGVTGNIQKAIEACDLWIQDYPRAELPHIYLGAAVLPVVGQNERAVEESVEGIRLRPDFAIAYGFGIRAYTAVDRYDEAKATYAQTLERKLHTPFIDRVMYELAFAENDTAGMAQHAAKLEILPRFGHQMLSMEGDTAAYS